MWDHLASSDLHRAKQEIERRRSETTNRHAEETKSLEARQAEEIQALISKEAEIELLGQLIENFTNEFVPERPHSEPGNDPADPVRGPGVDNADHPAVQVDQPSDVLLDAETAEASNAGLLQVRFPSPNFGAFRRFG